MPDEGCGLERRDFLKLGLMTLVVAGIDPSYARAAGVDAPPRGRSRRAGGKTLIFVFQRFGADGLNLVIPTEAGEYATYRSYRPTLAIDRNHPALGPLNTDFAFHPLLHDGLYSLWQRGNLAVLPNVGYTDGSRSHFDSQLFIENGTPWVRTTRDGWLNRYLQGAPPSADPLRALAFAQSVPLTLTGDAPALSLASVADLNISATNAPRNARLLDLMREAYAEPGRGRPFDAELSGAGQGLLTAIGRVPPQLPAPNVAYPRGEFSTALSQLSQLLRSDLFDVEIAQVDLGGWDTHTAQGTLSLEDRFPRLAAEFSDGLAAFVNDLGPTRMQDVVIVTTSEFGRTARENGYLGTDHGSAWASFVIGGGVRPGVYFGPQGWHGLSDLREGRDLKHSIDFRDVFSEALARHLGTLTPGVFPQWTYNAVGFL